MTCFQNERVAIGIQTVLLVSNRVKVAMMALKVCPALGPPFGMIVKLDLLSEGMTTVIWRLEQHH